MSVFYGFMGGFAFATALMATFKGEAWWVLFDVLWMGLMLIFAYTSHPKVHEK